MHIRYKNINNNIAYIRDLEKNNVPHETETLNLNEFINEKIITGLRTQWGFDLNNLSILPENLENQVYKKIKNFEIEDIIKIEDNHLKVKKKEWFLCDFISRELLLV